jgi:hypothetical protein
MEIHKLSLQERKDLYDAKYAEVLKEFRDKGGSIWTPDGRYSNWGIFITRVKELQKKYDV